MPYERIKEQEEVLESTGKNLIVSASAGSGKTTVMIRKIIKCMLEEKVSVKDILVLTYTKASAEEMKQKLLAKIYENASGDEFLASQIDDIPTANISTIHSFFQKIIKKNFFILSLDPNFALLDENQTENLRLEVLESAMQSLYENSPELYENLLEIYGNDRTDRKLQRVVKALNEFCLSLENSDEWLATTALKLYNDENLLISYLNENLCDKTDAFISKLSVLQAESVGQDFYIEYINVMLSSLKTISRKIDFFDNYNNFINFSFKNLKKDEENEIYKKLIVIKKNISAMAGELRKKELTKEKTAQILVESKKLALGILEVEKIFRKLYTEVKKEKNVLDFNDLELYMLTLLQNEKIKNALKKEFKYIFVDEYQDANLLQERIISSLSSGDNRFIVGDVKQSIYAFRQANPEIFLGLQESYDKDEKSESKTLNSNFRSRKEILDFVNSVFNKIMTPRTSGIDYENTSQFVSKASYKEESAPFVQIDVLKKDEGKEEQTAPEFYTLNAPRKGKSNAELEAKIVAERILELIGTKIYDKEIEDYRPVEFKDITILLASRGGYLDDFVTTLSSFGVPTFANSREKLYSENEVKILINILKLCLNLQDDISLASSLLNFGRLSLMDLKTVASASGKNLLEKSKNVQNVEISLKIADFFAIFGEFKENIINLGIYQAFVWLFKKTGYKPGKEGAQAVKKFLQDFLSNGFNYDAGGFLEFADKNLVEAPSVNAGENSVSITTMHSSKGLEYPIVFVVNAGADFTRGKKEYEIVINDKLGFALKNISGDLPSLVYEVISEKEKHDEFAEKLRLLYVALTRAKNRLFICGTKQGEFEKLHSDYDAMKMKTFLDLIVGAAGNDASIKYFKEEDLIQKEDIAPTNFKPDALLEKYFENYFSFKYAHEKETKLALKNSVSRITEEVGASQNLSPQKFLVSEHLNVSSSAEIGTTYHKILETNDFSKIFSPNDIAIPESEAGENIDINLLYNNVIKLKALTSGAEIFKEQEFMMYLPEKEVTGAGSEDKILVQGIIDLLILGKKNIIVDYKFSSIKNAEKLKQKYRTQLILYKKAAELALNIKVDEIYLLNLVTTELIKME